VIHHAWSVLCSQAILSQESNNFTLVEVVEQLGIVGAWPESPDKKPVAIQHQLELVSLFHRDTTPENETLSTRVSIVDPTGATLAMQDATIDFQKFERYRARSKLEAIPVTVPGVYLFVLEQKTASDWQKLATIPLKIFAGLGPAT
jgi:hypothetical protein